MRQDLIDFYACPSQNLATTIHMSEAWIAELEAGAVDVTRCWYLRQPLGRRRPGGIFTSSRSQLRSALVGCTPAERLALGYSYERFSRASRDIHFSPAAPAYWLDWRAVADGISRCGVLGLLIMLRCQLLTGLEPEGINSSLRAAFDANTAMPDHVGRATVGSFRAGDFVLAFDDLAEVVEVRTSEFGYRSYKVRYLAERPLSDVGEDWFVPHQLRLLYTKELLVEKAGELAAAGLVSAPAFQALGRLDQQAQVDVLREALVAAWSAGLREHFRGVADGD